MNPDSNVLYRALEEAVLAGARHLMSSIATRAAVQVRMKPDHTLILNLDLELQAIMVPLLASLLPVVAEEDESSHRLIDVHQSYFLVDPLDGTTTCKRFMYAGPGQVGFGPLAGLVIGGDVVACAYCNVPERILYTARRGEGCFATPLRDDGREVLTDQRVRLKPNVTHPLSESAVLFYAGKRGEMKLVEYLRNENLVENAYRFGGFANDCTRLARGSEQAIVQFSVRPWDFVAVLLATEAGYDAIVDPQGDSRRFTDWKLKANNPVLVAPAGSLETLAATARNLSPRNVEKR